MQIKITPTDDRAPAGQVATAELFFNDGPLAGLKLVGFAVWRQRSNPGHFNVTFPARSYAINGERRSFALLRPIASVESTDRLRDLIIDAYHQAMLEADEAGAF